jgi:hypothetical protein
VKWLFHAAGTPLPETGVEILNMREQDPDEVAARLLGRPVPGKPTTAEQEVRA